MMEIYNLAQDVVYRSTQPAVVPFKGLAGTYTASFGYKNPNNVNVIMPAGDKNRFSGGSSTNLGQPSTFKPGRQVAVFKVNWPGNTNLVWSLNGKTSTAGAGAAKNICPAN